MKIDLVTWVKNGAHILPYTLGRVERVIPQRVINKKVLIDDHSTDNSREIGESFGWEVHLNQDPIQPSLIGAISTAFSYVESPFFVSIEQDVLLAKNWWQEIPKHMEDPNVIVAQGIRYSTHPVLRALEEYAVEKGRRYHSLDNNLWRTELVRKVGGFPRTDFFVDYVFYDKILKTEYKWVVDREIVSEHLRGTIINQLRHAHKMQKFPSGIDKLSKAMMEVIKSPLTGVKVSIIKKRPEVSLVYPLLTIVRLRGTLSRCLC